MKNIYLAFLSAVFLSLILFLSGCAGNKDADEKEIKPKTLVTYTNISKEQLSETVDLNATSVFQIKDNVKSNLSGYIQEVHVKLGDFVKKGQILFALKTKEASALSNRSGDTTFNFAGVV
jgi:multidrug efflux pump subunit AcrA (membrane-fusion protein)